MVSALVVVVVMGESDAAEAPAALRRRATLAAELGASLRPTDGTSAAALQSSLAADVSRGNVPPETVRAKSKSDKRKRRSDVSDRLR